MNLKHLKLAMNEAERFLTRAEDLFAQQSKDASFSYHCPKEQAAVKRASMDLTRALTVIRKPRT